MNKHILTGVLPITLQGIRLVEASHTRWQEGTELNTYIDGSTPIDGVYHSPELEVTAVRQISFHEGAGDHCTVVVDITTRLVIGQQEYKIVRPSVCNPTTRNKDKESTKNYLKDMAKQFEMHDLVCHQEAIAAAIKEGRMSYSSAQDANTIDNQKMEIQCRCKSRSRKIRKPLLPFSLPVRSIHKQQDAYTNCMQWHEGKSRNSHIICNAIKA